MCQLHFNQKNFSMANRGSITEIKVSRPSYFTEIFNDGTILLSFFFSSFGLALWGLRWCWWRFWWDESPCHSLILAGGVFHNHQGANTRNLCSLDPKALLNSHQNSKMEWEHHGCFAISQDQMKIRVKSMETWRNWPFPSGQYAPRASAQNSARGGTSN